MWMSTLPWGVIGQGALSETIGSLIATGLLAGCGWLVRRTGRWRRSKAAERAADHLLLPSEHDGRIDA